MSVKDWTNLKLIDTLIVETLAISTGQGANRVALEVHDEIMLRLNQAQPPCSECATPSESENIIVRCHCCKGTQMWKRNKDGEIEVFHDCASGLQAELECTALRKKLDQWTKWGVVEVAVRNPQVAEYCEHWEGRAEKAEAECATLRKERDDAHAGLLIHERLLLAISRSGGSAKCWEKEFKESWAIRGKVSSNVKSLGII